MHFTQGFSVWRFEKRSYTPVLAETLANIKTIVKGTVSSVTSHVLEDVWAEIEYVVDVSVSATLLVADTDTWRVNNCVRGT